jgi:hypothetical protein
MQGTLLHTTTFPELTDLIRKEFVKNQELVTPAAMQLFIKDTIPRGNGNTKRYDEIDTQTFGRGKRQAEAAKKASVGVGYNVTMTKKRIAMEIDITQEMRDENRYAEVGSLITNLTHFCPQRIELDLTHVLTFAGATSYVDMDGDTVTTTVGDGLALASTVHTLKYSSLTYSNRVAGDPIFSRGALEGAESLAVTNILSNFGERRVITFNTIVTGDDPNTVNAVKQFLNSTSDVDQNNSGVMNLYNNKYRHVVLPYLATTATGAHDSTKKRYWFLVAAGQGTNGWQAYYGEWEAPHMKDSPTNETGANHDYSRDIWTFGVRAGYGIRAVTGRGFIASLPTS